MKPTLTALILLATASLAGALTTIGTVQHSNGFVTTPGFWTANSNALNAVVDGGGGSSFDQDLNTTNDVTFNTLTLPVGSATPQIVLPQMGGNITPGLWPSNQIGLFSKAGRLQMHVGTATNRIFAFLDETTNASNLTAGTLPDARLSTNVLRHSSGNVISGLPDTNPLTFSNPATFRGIIAGSVTNAVGIGDIAASDEVSGLRGSFAELMIGGDLAIFEDEFGRIKFNTAAFSPAWKLTAAPTNGIPTLATNEVGVGWDELGRFTIQTPVMPISVYETGSPSTPTIYIPGTVVVNRLSAIFFDSRVYASNIVGGPEGGTIPETVIQSSMTRPLGDWQDSSTLAGARGIPYILSNAVTQPETGTYVPYVITVDSGLSNNILQGRYTNLAGFRSLISAELAATNVTVTNAITLPAARRVIATIDSSLAGSSNTVTLQTNAPVHGDTVEARYVRTADSATVNIVDPFGPSTNALMFTRSMFWSYSTNTSPARWVPVGRTIGADVIPAALNASGRITNQLDSGALAAGIPRLSDGTGGDAFSVPTRWTVSGGTVTSNAPALSVSQTWNTTNVNDLVTLIITNTASSAESMFMRMTAGSDQIALRRDGFIFANGITSFQSWLPFAAAGSGPRFTVYNGYTLQRSTDYYGWAPSGTIASGTTGDLRLWRDNTGSLGQRDTNVAQTNNIYGTWTNSTNYRRLSIGMSNNGVGFIRPEQAGPSTNGTNFIYISGLPTTNTGLPSGVLWVSNGVVAVTP